MGRNNQGTAGRLMGFIVTKVVHHLYGRTLLPRHSQDDLSVIDSPLAKRTEERVAGKQI